MKRAKKRLQGGCLVFTGSDRDGQGWNRVKECWGKKNIRYRSKQEKKTEEVIDVVRK